jgi:hypothetical protein
VVERVNSSMVYLIHCKNICKCHNVPSLSTIIKKKSKKNKASENMYLDLDCFNCEKTLLLKQKKESRNHWKLDGEERKPQGVFWKEVT